MRPCKLASRFVSASIVVALAGCGEAPESEPVVPAGKADLAIPDNLSELQLLAFAGDAKMAFQGNVTYQITQYFENGTNPPVPGRLVSYPASPSPVYANPGNFNPVVVGYVFVSRQTDGSDIQRWLLLHETQMASACDMEIKPATTMGGAPSPTTVAGFVAKAQSMYDARKTAAGVGRPTERTRYVKVRCRSHVINDSVADAPPDTGVPAPPASLLPVGNGLWTGGTSFQLDTGSVGIWAKGSGELVGYMQENNGGFSGTEQWELADLYVPPTGADPILVGKTAHMGATGDSVADLGEIVSGGSERQWNLLREAATYYGNDFPAANP